MGESIRIQVGGGEETDILTEVDTYDWITFLPIADGTGAYNRYLAG